MVRRLQQDASLQTRAALRSKRWNQICNRVKKGSLWPLFFFYMYISLMSYIDGYKDIERIEQDMLPNEKEAFSLGYIAALQGVIEDINETKVRISTVLMDGPENEQHRRQLHTRLKLLDLFESKYMRRVQRLEQE